MSKIMSQEEYKKYEYEMNTLNLLKSPPPGPSNARASQRSKIPRRKFMTDLVPLIDTRSTTNRGIRWVLRPSSKKNVSEETSVPNTPAKKDDSEEASVSDTSSKKDDSEVPDILH